MILIKKYHFDLLFMKNINKTLSIRVVLFVTEFEIDFYQKAKVTINNINKPNINQQIDIVSLLKLFFYNFKKVKKILFNF